MELMSEDLEELLLLQLLRSSISLLLASAEVVVQLRLDVLEEGDEGLHGFPVLHARLMHLIPHDQRKSFLGVA
jgi:hypothetical protein